MASLLRWTKGMHYIQENTPRAARPCSNDSTVVTDGNSLFYSIRKALKTFKDLASFIFDMIPIISQVHFSADMYKEFSVKSMERIRRGNSDPFIIKGGNTKVPQDFKGFLCNEENKKQLICLLLKEWNDDCYAPRTRNRNIYFVCGEECFKLEADSSKVKCTKISNLGSSQEEIDTKVVLHMMYAADNHHSSAILVRSPDSDIFFIFLYYAAEVNATIIFDTGMEIIGVCLIYLHYLLHMAKSICEALLSLHAFTLCDTTSAFVHIGKVKPIKILEKFPHFQQSLRELGENLDLNENAMDDLERFVCAMYGSVRSFAMICSWKNASWIVLMQIKVPILVFFYLAYKL